jgi:DNA-binding transcriptional MerR regulator
MLISEIANSCGLTVETLRYYDSIGLLTPKRINNIRNYTDADRNKLKIIVAMKNMKFSLKEIKKIMKFDDLITKDLDEDKLNQENCENLLQEIKNKFAFIKKQEEDLMLIKSKLNKIIMKINNLMDGGNYEFTDS